MTHVTRRGIMALVALTVVAGGATSAQAEVDTFSTIQSTYLGSTSTQTFEAHALNQGTDAVTGEKIIIAVVGEGVDAAYIGGAQVGHEDLIGKLFENLSEKNGTAGVDDDANGKVDDFIGWDFTSAGPGDNDPRPEGSPLLARATGMAGIAAAQTGNGLGIAAVCPDCVILNIRAYTSVGPGTTAAQANANLVAAITYAADVIRSQTTHKKGVILLSMNGLLVEDPTLKALLDTLYDQDAPYDAASNGGTPVRILVVAAAGNSASDVPNYPCAYGDVDQPLKRPVLCVGATDTEEDVKDMRSVFSNFGPWVVVSAPGQDILTTLPGGSGNQYGFLTFAPGEPSGGRVRVTDESGSDTAAAAAIVAGQAALVLAASTEPDMTPELAQQIIRFGFYSADTLPVGQTIEQYTFDLASGSGRINTKTAVLDAKGLLEGSSVPCSARLGPVALLDYPENNRPVTPGEALVVAGSVVGNHYTVELYKEQCPFCVNTAQRYDSTFTPVLLYDVSSPELIAMPDPGTALLPSETFMVPPELAEGSYVIQLKVTRTGSVVRAYARVRIIVEASYMAGWPKPVDDTLLHGANLADITGDGLPEIIIGSAKAGKQGVYVFDHLGTQLFRDPASGAANKTLLRTCNAGNTLCGRVFSTPAVGDVDGNGTKEIIATAEASSSPALFVWTNTGAPRFTASPGSIKSSPALGPATTSTTKDVFVTLKNNWLRRYDAAGTLKGEASLTCPVSPCGQTLMESTPLLADLTGDGLVEVVVTSQDPLTTYGFSTQGANGLDLLPGFPLTAVPPQNAPGMIFDASMGDFNNNGKHDMLLARVRKTEKDSELVLVERDPLTGVSTTLQTYNPPMKELFMYVGAATADVGTFVNKQFASPDKDGKLETVIVGMSGRVFLLDDQLKLMASVTGNVCQDGTAGQWPQRMKGRGAGNAVIADLDYDGIPEILTTGSDKAMYAWDPKGCLKRTLSNGSGGATYGFPRGLKAPACVSPLPSASPLLNWPVEEISRCAAPAVADLNGDTRLELVGIAGSGVTGENEIVVWTLGPPRPADYVGSPLGWGLTGANALNTRTTSKVLISGIVRTPTSAPISGATVAVQFDQQGTMTTACQTTSAATTGAFSCAVNPRDATFSSLTGTTFSYGVKATDPSYMDATTYLTQDVVSDVSGVIVVQASRVPVTVWGIVSCGSFLSTSASPIAGASVTITPYGGGPPVCATTTDATGRYSCLVPSRDAPSPTANAYYVAGDHPNCKGSGTRGTAIHQILSNSPSVEASFRMSSGYLGCMLGCC